METKINQSIELYESLFALLKNIELGDYSFAIRTTYEVLVDLQSDYDNFYNIFRIGSYRDTVCPKCRGSSLVLPKKFDYKTCLCGIVNYLDGEGNIVYFTHGRICDKYLYYDKLKDELNHLDEQILNMSNKKRELHQRLKEEIVNLSENAAKGTT